MHGPWGEREKRKSKSSRGWKKTPSDWEPFRTDWLPFPLIHPSIPAPLSQGQSPQVAAHWRGVLVSGRAARETLRWWGKGNKDKQRPGLLLGDVFQFKYSQSLGGSYFEILILAVVFQPSEIQLPKPGEGTIWVWGTLTELHSHWPKYIPQTQEGACVCAQRHF